MFFRHTLYNDGLKQIGKSNFKFAYSQHNGDVFVRLTPDNTLLRKRLDMDGKIYTYLPRKATDREIQLYALT